MSEQMIIQNCSPTLAGIKTGNIFSCPCDSEQQMRSTVRNINQRLVPKGLRLIPLRYRNGKSLLYLYRPSHLKRDLSDETVNRLLNEHGYPCGSCNGCVVHLMNRLRGEEEFPHEIGLFLGYPPEDVCGFIENKAACAKCVGCWKVYGDEEKAKRKFAQFNKCTRIYSKLWEKGRSLEQLAVKC